MTQDELIKYYIEQNRIHNTLIKITDAEIITNEIIEHKENIENNVDINRE